jgi:hypothetical protein
MVDSWHTHLQQSIIGSITFNTPFLNKKFQVKLGNLDRQKKNSRYNKNNPYLNYRKEKKNAEGMMQNL